VQALFRIRSAEQRLAVRLPAGSRLDAEPQIDGRRVSLELAEGGVEDEYLVPLVRQDGRDADKPFLLELRYTVPSQGNWLRLDRPVFPLATDGTEGSSPGGIAEPAMQQFYLCVYLPEERDLVAKRGPWTAQYRWSLSDTLDFRPVSRPNDLELLRWVAPEEDLTESFLREGRLAGRLYVFSSLRPAPPPEGTLRLLAVDAGWLSTCVIGLIVVAGIILVPFGAGKRVLVAGVLAVGLIVLGVVNPILVRQICDGAMLSACLIVLVVWAVWYLVWTLPRAVARRGAGGGGPPGPASEPATPNSPFAGPPDSQKPQPAPEPPSSPPGSPEPSLPPPPPSGSGLEESAILWGSLEVEQPADAERPPGEDASAEAFSPEQEPESDRNQGGPSDA
jgi:hypothetical protein